MADAAEAVASAASQLVAATVRHTEMRYEAEWFLGGEITAAPDLGLLDECVGRFYVAAAKDTEK